MLSNSTKHAPPSTPTDFDRAYRALLTPWGDVRVPPEIKSLAARGSGQRTLELGCGVGRFSRYLARQGLRVTAVDFSPVAVAKARAAAAQDPAPPEFFVADVTDLDAIDGPFDFSFDVGCFHCLDVGQQRRYASQVQRLLRPGGTHLIWALDAAPSDIPFSPDTVRKAFATGFTLADARPSRRRLARSHWYWLTRNG